MMCVLRAVLFVSLILSGCHAAVGSEGINYHSAHKTRQHKSYRKHRAANDSALHFEPKPYNKNFELNSSGKIHCKVAGGVAPTVQWFLGIQALDLLHSKASINVTAGGVGHSFVNLRLKSERGTGLDYDIGIYVSPNYQ